MNKEYNAGLYTHKIQDNVYAVNLPLPLLDGSMITWLVDIQGGDAITVEDEGSFAWELCNSIEITDDVRKEISEIVRKCGGSFDEQKSTIMFTDTNQLCGEQFIYRCTVHLIEWAREKCKR